jgi:hypothetical protein
LPYQYFFEKKGRKREKKGEKKEKKRGREMGLRG